MSDELNLPIEPETEETQPSASNLDETAPAEPQGDTAPAELTRVFKTGSTRIPDDEATRGKTVAEVQSMLAAAYPELKNATPRERKEGNIQVVEFLPSPGRKG